VHHLPGNVTAELYSPPFVLHRTETVNPASASAWLATGPEACLWHRAGVWRVNPTDPSRPELLRPAHFALAEGQSWVDDFMVPFWRRFEAAVNAAAGKKHRPTAAGPAAAPRRREPSGGSSGECAADLEGGVSACASGSAADVGGAGDGPGDEAVGAADDVAAVPKQPWLVFAEPPIDFADPANHAPPTVGKGEAGGPGDEPPPLVDWVYAPHW